MLRTFRIVAALLLSASVLRAQHATTYGDYVVYSWTSSDRLAQRVVDTAHQLTFPGLGPGAPAYGKPLHIVLAPDDRQFRVATGGRAPDWGAGIASPGEGVVVLKAYGGTGGALKDLRSLLHHELAHIALHRYLRDARIPRWFDEGYAVWASGELDMDGAWLLRVAFATNRAPSLDSLELTWPALSTDARVAYLLSASAVQYLVDASGTRALELFMQRWRASGSFEGALASTYGLSLDQLEVHWRKSVREKYGWFAILAQSAVFATFAALGITVLFLIRRRRDRAKLAQLKASEPPDERAYWTEDGDEFDQEAIDRNEKPPNI